MSQVKYWKAVNAALHEEMERDERVCLWGEDVGTAGGAFAASTGLQERFGGLRVRDTPISEEIIVGAAAGAAMAGLRPVVEVMFLDFIALAMDQLVNQAAKMRYMSAGALSVPMVVRCLVGSGRGAGPQHGQNLEAWLAHVPGLKVVWPSTPADAKGLLKAAIRDDDPVVVIENLALWGSRGEVPDGDHVTPIGSAVVRREGTDATLVSWGSCAHRCMAAAETLAHRGVSVEVVELRSLNPIDTTTVLASLERTGRLVVAHDAVAPLGVGAELAALAAGRGFAFLRAPVVRVTPPFAPVPFPNDLERAYFPQAEAIADGVTQVLEQA